jgi:hypothetical protein
MSRLYIIPARDVPIAAILRRGPSRWYHVIRWDMAHDKFTHGSWIKGRIYPSKCDVSPDGELFLYFVHMGSRFQTDFSDSWTAVSRLPWLTALTLWPHGTTYGGGGRFVENRRLMLRTVYGAGQATHPDFPLRGLTVIDGDADELSSGNLVADADWSGHDHAGRVIFAMSDCVYRRDTRGDTLVADFSTLNPDPQAPPPEASLPLPENRNR